jgi:hypothetical protein
MSNKLNAKLPKTHCNSPKRMTPRHAIQTYTSKTWYAIRTFQFIFIVLACNSNAPVLYTSMELVSKKSKTNFRKGR